MSFKKKGNPMEELEVSLKKFVTTCQKYRLSGYFETITDIDTLFPFGFPRSPEVEYFFKYYNPVALKIETGFTPFKFHSITELVKAQSGYASFPENFIVIGDDLGGGKPLIAVIENEKTTIYANYDIGEPFRIADTFSSLIASLTELVDVVYGSYNIFDIADDDDVIKKDFKEELQKRITRLIGAENFMAFYDYFYG